MLDTTNGYVYPEKDELTSITELAKSLRFNPKKHDFNEDDYIPITLIKAKDLYVDIDYQRLIHDALIRKAGKFDKDLVRSPTSQLIL